ncbi:MAG: hypothetical protein OJF49_002232 [Ktedonobacterales bacterium]|nr:MAG: hypothetical protein OJF49_002232 [Ktedonobacterales bacterium]
MLRSRRVGGHDGTPPTGEAGTTVSRGGVRRDGDRCGHVRTKGGKGGHELHISPPNGILL